MKQVSGEMLGLDHIIIIKINFTTINEISSAQETFKLCSKFCFSTAISYLNDDTFLKFFFNKVRVTRQS